MTRRCTQGRMMSGYPLRNSLVSSISSFAQVREAEGSCSKSYLFNGDTMGNHQRSRKREKEDDDEEGRERENTIDIDQLNNNHIFSFLLCLCLCKVFLPLSLPMFLFFFFRQSNSLTFIFRSDVVDKKPLEGLYPKSLLASG